MGYCKHEWKARSEQLRAVFGDGGKRVHEFFVCRRCLKIREVETPARPAKAGVGGHPAA